jgi:hypothetical protein
MRTTTDIDFKRIANLDPVVDKQTVEVFINEKSTTLPKLDEIKFLYFTAVYEATNFNVKKTAHILGIRLASVYNYEYQYRKMNNIELSRTKMKRFKHKQVGIGLFKDKVLFLKFNSIEEAVNYSGTKRSKILDACRSAELGLKVTCRQDWRYV